MHSRPRAQRLSAECSRASCVILAGRLDDKQGGDTIVTMERVRDAIAFNVELADESKWSWLTSEQRGSHLRPTGGG